MKVRRAWSTFIWFAVLLSLLRHHKTPTHLHSFFVNFLMRDSKESSIDDLICIESPMAYDQRILFTNFLRNTHKTSSSQARTSLLGAIHGRNTKAYFQGGTVFSGSLPNLRTHTPGSSACPHTILLREGQE